MAQKKKKTTKKPPKKQNNKPKTKNRLFLISAFFIILFLGVGFYGYLVKTPKETPDKSAKILRQTSTKELMQKMQKMLDTENARLKNSEKQMLLDKVLNAKKKKITKDKNSKKESEKLAKNKKQESEKQDKNRSKHSYLSEVHDFQKSLTYSNTKKNISKKTVKFSGKPRLAIIIDDVSFLYQVKQIKKIPFKVTPSFFPPTKIHPDTVKLSHKFKFAMVHLPLEAMGYVHSEPKTLKVKSSRKAIEARINEIKAEFPQIHYYNNHTGSRFTADKRVMRYLISYMKKKNLHFVDSRTTIATKAGAVCKALHVKLLSRDVFLDNVAEPKQIIEQLKKAVKLAKKSGYAIAIGHPHKNTLKTLVGAKRYLKDVDVVYVNEL